VTVAHSPRQGPVPLQSGSAAVFLPPLSSIFTAHGTVFCIPHWTKAGGGGNWFPGAFHSGLVEVLGEDACARVPGHNPNSSVTRNWFHETYAIPTITYEVGDNVPVEAMRSTARLSAEITMRPLQQGGANQPATVQDGVSPE